MEGVHYVADCLGGAFWVNAIPHFVSGVMGRAFQSPFANPPGKGLSSSTVNVLWGALNFAVAYLLIWRVGAFDVQAKWDAVAAGIGGVAMGLMLARWFGQFHGGNSPI